MKTITRSALVLLLAISLYQAEANVDLRQRFLSLRNRSSSLRKSTSTTTAAPETTSAAVTEQQTASQASTTTEAFTTTVSSSSSVPSLKERLAQRRPQLRFGLRPSGESKDISKKPEKKDTELKKDESKKEETGRSSFQRGRINFSLRNRHNKKEAVNKIQETVEVDKPKSVEETPEVVEIPAVAPPLFRRPPFPSRFQRKNEATENKKKEEIELPQPLESFELKAVDSKVDLNTKSILSKNVEMKSKTIESAKPKPFSFKFNPSPNPLRNVVPDVQQHLPEKKVEMEKSEVMKPTAPTLFATESPINSFDNYFEAERFPDSTLENETLITSETRTRSKIEIKEVNGTLYEYEYIYYYDDEEPLFDYDIPAIIDAETASGPNELVKQPTTAAPLPKTTLAPQTKNSRVRNQGSHLNEIVQDQVSETRTRGRPTSRQSSRNRGNSRALVQETAPTQSVTQDLSVDELILPAQTRFPPRPTPPSRIVNSFEETRKKGFEEHLQNPLVPGFTGDRQEPLPFNLQTTSEFITEPTNEFGGELTTENPSTPSDTAAINLYALSKAVDADFDSTSTISPDNLDSETQTPLDYESFYDYDFTLSELTEFDIGTTADTILVTEEPTTVAPTTTPATTTTTTTTPTTATPTRGRFRGAPRIRGRTQTPQPDKPESAVHEEPLVVPSEKTIQPQRTRGRLSRPSLRKGRLGSRTKPTEEKTLDDKLPKETENQKEIETISESPTTVATTQKPRRRGPSRRRPRPNIRNRFKSKQNEEEVTKTETVDIVEEEAKEKTVQKEEVEKVAPISLAKPTPPARRNRPSRPNRPRPRNNLLSRFNRGRPAQEKSTTEETATDSSLKNETESVSESEVPNELDATKLAAEEEPAVIEAPQKPTRRVPGKSHRFNLPNRFSKARGSRVRQGSVKNNEEPTATEESVISVIPSEGEAIDAVVGEEASTTTAAPQSTLRTRGRPGKHRFRERPGRRRTPGHLKAQPVEEVAKDDALEPEITSESSLASEAVDTSDQSITEASSRAHRGRGRNRFVPGKRNSSSRRLSSLIGTTTPEESSPTIENPDIEKTAAVKETLIEKEISPAKESNIAPSQDVEATDDEIAAEPEAEPEAEPDQDSETSTDETPAEATTEKLTRRQLLAQRRSKFIG